MLKQEQRAGLLLAKYQEIWQKGAIIADGSKEQQELLLSGLIVKDDGKLTVFNPIYHEIFNNHWIERELTKLRPYSAAITAWLNSHYQDESRLLRGQALADALAWKKGKSLGDMDHQFLEASQQLEQRKTEISLAIETEAKQKANKRMRIGSAILFISFIGTMILGLLANQSFQRLQEARESIKLEREATTAWQQFEFAQLDALLSAIEINQKLQSLVQDNRSLEKYPAINPILTLQRILYNIAPQQFISWQSDLGSVIDASPNINLIVILSEDGTTRLLNFSGKQLNKLENWVFSVDFSSNGQLMATAEWEEGVKLWNLSGNILAKFGNSHSRITHISFTPDGELIATVDEEEGIKLWNLSGNILAKFGSTQTWITDLSFSTDGQLIATADEDGKIEIWNRFGKQQGSFQADLQWLTAVNFSPNGKQLLTTSKEGKIRFWSFSGKQQGIILAHQGEITHMSFSPDGQLFATAGVDGTVKLWLLSGQQLAQFDRQDSVTSLSFTTDGKEIIVGNADGKIWLLPVPTLDKLLEEGCQWLEDYLRTHDKKLEACSEQ